MGYGRMGGVEEREFKVAWEEGGAPTRGQSGGCTSEGILSMMMARLCLLLIIMIIILILLLIIRMTNSSQEKANPLDLSKG